VQLDSNESEISKRLRAIPNRLAVTDASRSSGSFDITDSSSAVAPDTAATSAHVSDAPTSTTPDQDSFLIVFNGASSLDLPSCTAALENAKRESPISSSKQTSATNIEQTYRPRLLPVPPPRRPKPVTKSNPSELTQLSVSVASNEQKPAADVSLQSSSFVASFVPAQSVQEARALFIQSTTPPIVKVNPRQSSLDQFDPLASGQLVVDGPTSRVSSVAESAEENLLKEWDLDFTKSAMSEQMRFAHPDASLQPRVLVPPASSSAAVYASMPNLGAGSSMRMHYPAYGVPFPSSQPVRQPWMVNLGVRQHQSSVPAAGAALNENGSHDGTNKCATLPPGLPPWTTQASSSALTSSAVDVAGDWTANIDVLMRPHSMDLSAFTSTPTNSQQPSTNQSLWETFD